MELIKTKEVATFTRLNNFAGDSATKLVMNALQIDKFNQLYAKHCDKSVLEFIESVLDEVQAKYQIDESDLARIPQSGPFIIVANHPFGGIEGLILLNYLLKIRPDFKVMGNFLLNRIDPIKEYVLAVNPFEDRKHVFSSFNGLRKAYSHIREGHPLAIFPAGEVSTYYYDRSYVADRDWNQSIMRFIKESKVPVVPVYFHGSNSSLFHFMGKLHPALRTAKLPSELFNKHKEKIVVRIGRALEAKEYQDLSDTNVLGKWLRARTYLLEAGIKPEPVVGDTRNVKLQAIAPAVPRAILTKEIEKLSPNYLLYQWQNFSLFCAPTSEIPHIAFELGRLREITFRAVGEGTGKSSDFDSYDWYYQQLFIWDKEAEKIVGGYRIGMGKDIIAQYGIKGLYTNSLFKIDEQMRPMLEESLELGRSFVVQEYQRKPMSLFMLWKGILYFLLKNEDYRYLIGPVSISNSYSDLSKQIITTWVNKHYQETEVARLVRPRTPYVPAEGKTDVRALVDTLRELNSADQLIKDIEPSGAKMPVLLKKYISLGGKIASFNVDPQFNNALDGLLILDLHDVPVDVVHSLSKELHQDILPGKPVVRVL